MSLYEVIAFREHVDQLFLQAWPGLWRCRYAKSVSMRDHWFKVSNVIILVV